MIQDKEIIVADVSQAEVWINVLHRRTVADAERTLMAYE